MNGCERRTQYKAIGIFLLFSKAFAQNNSEFEYF